MNEDSQSATLPRLGVSHCLLGAPLRYDGGHRRHDWLVQALAPHVALLPLCPEDEAGLGTPREPMHLQAGKAGRVRLVGNQSGQDVTERLQSWIDRRIPRLRDAEPDGFVLKARSPSCGRQTPVVGLANHEGGLFHRAVATALPDLPRVDEASLNQSDAREAFCIRLFAHARLRHFFASDWQNGDLVRFHSQEKMLLLAHDRPLYDQLGRLVAKAADHPRAEFEQTYRQWFMRALARPTSRGRHGNVLQHLAGHFRGRLSPADAAALQAAIDAFQRGETDRPAVLERIRALAEKTDRDWVARQSYLAPCPNALLAACRT